MKEIPSMFYPFDSYVENGKIIIMTKEYDDYAMDLVPVRNEISLERAKEIIADLQLAVKNLEQ